MASKPDICGRSTVVVVGAGPSGLTCAARLAAHWRVLLVDRIPVAGGESGWQSPHIADLVQQAKRAGVQLELGTTALRWEDHRLLLAAPGDIHWVEASRLVFAGGVRPETASELRLTGDRPAGVVPATVAAHLLTAGERLWNHACIIGDGRWGEGLSRQLHALGATVHAVTGGEPVGWADEQTRIDDTHSLAVVGGLRVEALHIDGPRPKRIDCDAIILAGDGRPTRNVVGALEEAAEDVVFVQPVGLRTSTERAAAAGALIDTWISAQLERTLP